MDGVELFDFLRKDQNMKLKQFLPIIEDSPVYPVIKDANGVVLSLPPIINGEHSKITLDTKNVLIEITATDYTKAIIGLNNIVTAFSLYSEEKFTFEQVEVTKADGTIEMTPSLDTRTVTSNVTYLNKLCGTSLPSEEVGERLKKMGFEIVRTTEEEVEVRVPTYRSDVLHPCDVAEDLAISYGFDNIVQTMPPIQTVGKQNELNQMTDLLRVEVCSAGYKECLNFALCSVGENTEAINQPDVGKIVTI